LLLKNKKDIKKNVLNAAQENIYLETAQPIKVEGFVINVDLQTIIIRIVKNKLIH
jgi:hypothetical protein